MGGLFLFLQTFNSFGFGQRSFNFYYRVDDDQVAVISPGTQLHGAVLEVEGEMQHNDFTVAPENGRWVPCDHPGVLQQHFGLMNNGEVTISTVGADKHRQHQHGR